MFLYEVNLYIQENCFSDFLPWLKKHINEILDLPGFISAEIWNREPQEPPEHAPLEPLIWITVHYRLKSKADFEHYLNNHAEKMRADGLKHFSGSFSADRRCYELLE